MRKTTSFALAFFLMAASSQLVPAGIKNRAVSIGQFIFNATPGAPLTVDVNGQLTSGEPATTYVSSTASTSVATSASYATISGSTITPTFAGTFQVECRTAVTHTTNNADVLMAVHVAGTIVNDSIVSVRPFIQGGVTPSLSVPMCLFTNSEVTITVGQAISCEWRTSAGTAVAPNSHSILIRRVR